MTIKLKCMCGAELYIDGAASAWSEQQVHIFNERHKDCQGPVKLDVSTITQGVVV